MTGATRARSPEAARRRRTPGSAAGLVAGVALAAALVMLPACGNPGGGSGARAAVTSRPTAETTPELAEGDVPAKGLELIDSTEVREHLSVFASDSFLGRRAGTRGADLAADFLAHELRELELVPLGPDSSYLQRFQLPGLGEGRPDSTQNVVALVRGSDPEHAGQYVALGAHYDHLGIGPPDVTGDSIYNGADDDGSGTIGLLEVAEAFARGPRPRRSVLFVFHGAEELGLLGSFFFTLQPPVPRDSIVAQLNVDMIGRNAPDSLFIIGSGRISSDLDAVIREQAEAAGIMLDYTYDAPDHPERLYYRSDHYNYAQYGIPVAFFFAGLHPDYHRPSDEIDKIDFGKIERVSELLYRVAWQLANRPEPPARDRLPQ